MKNTFAVKDLSSVTLTIDAIDYATVGEYTVNLYATDESGNVADKEIKVIVNEPTLTIEQANISIAVGETAQLNATVQGASQTITWTSSDESIATVDANGVVTGIKKRNGNHYGKRERYQRYNRNPHTKQSTKQQWKVQYIVK